MLDIDQNGLHTAFRQHFGTIGVRFLPVFLEPRLEQFVVHRHAAQQLAIGMRGSIIPLVRRRKHVSNLQAATCPHDHPAMPRIANAIDRREPANLTHRTNTN